MVQFLGETQAHTNQGLRGPQNKFRSFYSLGSRIRFLYAYLKIYNRTHNYFEWDSDTKLCLIDLKLKLDTPDINSALLRQNILKYFSCKRKIVVVSEPYKLNNSEDYLLSIEIHFSQEEKPTDDYPMQVVNDIFRMINNLTNDKRKTGSKETGIY